MLIKFRRTALFFKLIKKKKKTRHPNTDQCIVSIDYNLYRKGNIFILPSLIKLNIKKLC